MSGDYSAALGRPRPVFRSRRLPHSSSHLPEALLRPAGVRTPRALAAVTRCFLGAGALEPRCPVPVQTLHSHAPRPRHFMHLVDRKERQTWFLKGRTAPSSPHPRAGFSPVGGPEVGAPRQDAPGVEDRGEGALFCLGLHLLGGQDSPAMAFWALDLSRAVAGDARGGAAVQARCRLRLGHVNGH